MRSPVVTVPLLLLLLWLLVHSPAPANGRRDNQPYQVDQNLLVLQCQMLFCARRNSERTHTCDYSYCHKKLAHDVRPGSCPAYSALNHTTTTTTTTSADVASNAIGRWPLNTLAARQHCRHLCGGDSACPAAQKCCASGCGRSCQPAAGLADVPMHILPAIPANLTVVPQQPPMLMAGQQRSAGIRFVLPNGGGSDFRLMLEARNHAGFAFRPRKLGPWYEMPYNYTMSDRLGDRTAYMLTLDALRPGRWYQFRAATMGAAGTRGYSTPSPEFQLREKPRNPHPPRNFTVAVAPRLQHPNGTVYARLAWRPPRSDYPVEKYRLTWELPLPALTTALPDVVSVSQREAIITEPVRHYEFFDLRPNVVYTVHLQALTSFGRRRMKSTPATLLLSTQLTPPPPPDVAATATAHRPHDHRTHSAEDAAPPQIHVRLLTSSVRRSAVTTATPTAAAAAAAAAATPTLVARVQWSEHYAGSRVDLRQLGDNDGDSDSDDAAGVHRIGGESKTVAGRAQRSVDFGALHWQRRYAVRLQNAATGEWQSKEFRTPVCAEYRVRHPRVQC